MRAVGWVCISLEMDGADEMIDERWGDIGKKFLKAVAENPSLQH